jgi:DNA-binding IclR family transcriptional regulator
LGHCTALGKAILAYLPEKELDSYLRGSGLKRFTEFTITQRDELDAELARIRRQGFAIDNQEFSLGLRCVAVPAFDYTGHICCSISISALDKHMADIRIEEMQRELRRVSLVLSQKLGAPEALVETIFAPSR